MGDTGSNKVEKVVQRGGRKPDGLPTAFDELAHRVPWDEVDLRKAHLEVVFEQRAASGHGWNAISFGGGPVCGLIACHNGFVVCAF